MNEVSDELKIIFDRTPDNPNLAYVKVYAPNDAELRRVIGALYVALSYDNDNVKHSWEYKQGFSDGKEHLFNKQNQTLPLGLVTRAYKLIRIAVPEIKVEFAKPIWDAYGNPNGELLQEKIREYCDSLKIYNTEEDFVITPYDHQIRLIDRAINGRLISLMACTSAGKSLSQYVISRYLSEVEKHKVLIIVPSSGLVEQMYRDFHVEYGWVDAPDKMTLIHGTSRDKLSKKKKQMLSELGLGEEAVLRDVVISTWQSLSNKDQSFYEVFGAVIVDEAHGSKAPELKRIIDSCINANLKIGLSGTIPEDGLDAALIEGALGRREIIVRTAELIEKGLLTKTEIIALKLHYREDVRRFIGRQDYRNEFELVTGNGSRKQVLDVLLKSKQINEDQNTLILFKRKESIDVMKEFLEEHYPQYKILVIKGEVAASTRDKYRQVVNSGTAHIILATYGTMKQGVNIKFLHNLIFAEFSKSMYEVVQSIGRVVRFHKRKPLARVFDIVDDASYTTRSRRGGMGNYKMNYAMKHYHERKKYYADDKFPVTEVILPFEATIDPEDLDRKKKEAAKKAASRKSKKDSKIVGKGKTSQFLT